MDASELLPQLESAVPGALLEARPFGRSGALSLWIEMKAIGRVAEHLKSGYDWLENMTVFEVDQALVLTYFVRSSSDPAAEKLVLRGSLAPRSPEAEVDAFSVVGSWPMADAFEREAADLFGIRFVGNSATDRPRCGFVLPEDWVGYPLRKAYVFPMEYQDIPHSRSVGRSGPDEHALDFGAGP